MYATTLQRAWTSLVHAGPGNVLERQNMLELSLEQAWGRPGDVEQACNRLAKCLEQVRAGLEQVWSRLEHAFHRLRTSLLLLLLFLLLLLLVMLLA